MSLLTAQQALHRAVAAEMSNAPGDMDTFLPSAPEELLKLDFQTACKRWLAIREGHISAKTHKEYRLNIGTLAKYFGDFRLNEITPEMFTQYQKERRANGRRSGRAAGQPVGANAINKELGVLQQVLKYIGAWGKFERFYRPLPIEEKETGQALTPEQKARLMLIAESNPRWIAAYLFAVISVNTSAGPKEVSTLRLRDVSVYPLPGEINVWRMGAKNKYRVRQIPLNDESRRAVEKALERARTLGAIEPDHFLFPYCATNGKHRSYDPTRPAATFRTAWNSLRNAAGLPTLRMYDLRHTAITNMLADPRVAEKVVEDIAGHLKASTKRRYSHIRRQYREEAVAALVDKNFTVAPLLVGHALIPGDFAMRANYVSVGWPMLACYLRGFHFLHRCPPV